MTPAKTFTGDRPCGVCGSREKYINGLRCAPCRRTAEGKRRLTPRGKRLRAEAQKRAHATPGYKEWRKAWGQKYAATPKGKQVRRAAHIKWKLGVSAKEQARLLDSQKGLCAICGDGPDHATGQVRGYLCQGCNLGLGGFKDSPARLRAAVAYLKRNAPTLPFAVREVGA